MAQTISGRMASMPSSRSKAVARHDDRVVGAQFPRLIVMLSLLSRPNGVLAPGPRDDVDGAISFPVKLQA
jgi:hypothetical protein